MEEIIPWEKLSNIKSLSNGPEPTQMNLHMAWLNALKIVIEITLLATKSDPTTYFDRTVIYNKKKRKSVEKNMKEIDRNSDDDFVDPAPKIKKPKKLVPANKQKTTGSQKNKTNTAAATPVTRRVSVIKQLNKQAAGKDNKENHAASNRIDTPEDTKNNDTADQTSDDGEPLTDDDVDPITPPPCTRSYHVSMSESLRKLEYSSQMTTPPKKHPLKLNSPKPTSKCFYRWHTLTGSPETLSTFKHSCRVQLISVNSTTKHAPCNIRISDGQYWIDAEVADNLRIHFLNNLVVENDILVIVKTEGNLRDKNFKILAFIRPQYAQNNGERNGNPVPLLENTIISARNIASLNIKPLASADVASINDSELEELVTGDITMPETVFNDCELELSTAGENLINQPTPSTSGLRQFLNGPLLTPTIQKTGLKNLKVSMEELEKLAISNNVFQNAKDLIESQYDTGDPKMISNSARWTIKSEFNLEYDVRIRWPQMEPRTPRSWTRSYPCSCTCPGFSQFGPSKLCKHILVVLMKNFMK